MRPHRLAMAGPQPGKRDRGVLGNGGPTASGEPDPFGNRPRQVAVWASVIGPIAAQIIGGVVVLYEVFNNINDPAALGAGLTALIGGKFADVLSELLKPNR